MTEQVREIVERVNTVASSLDTRTGVEYVTLTRDEFDTLTAALTPHTAEWDEAMALLRKWSACFNHENCLSNYDSLALDSALATLTTTHTATLTENQRLTDALAESAAEVERLRRETVTTARRMASEALAALSAGVDK